MLRLLPAALAVLTLLRPSAAPAQPVPSSLRPDLEVRLVSDGVQSAVRIAHDASTDRLCVLTVEGAVSCFARPFGGAPAAEVYGPDDHGLSYPVLGMAVAPDGTMYLVGNEVDAANALNTGVVVRGRPASGGERVWETVARTEPYPRSNTSYDHNLNDVAVGPDGAFLYVNSGSRTDHGEVQDADGRYPGLREVPLTSAILRIPADAEGLLLRNDEAFLGEGGYLFADGTRNSFSLAFDADGVLFGAENAGDRDDSEELNVLEEGRHYGFPWRIGLSDTPQQAAGYDPGEDALLNPASAAVQGGFFHDDPAYPPPPPGVSFTDPIPNLGPDADLYRDPRDGTVKDASEEGVPFATFTPHRSPLGLVFDTDRALPAGFTGDGFVLSWTSRESPLLDPFGDEGEDLVQLHLAPRDGAYEVRAERLVRGFRQPIDATLAGDRLYVVESGADGRIWEVAFASPVAAEEEVVPEAFSVELYPHPVAGEARVVVVPERAGRVSIDVYSVLGRRVLHVHDGFLEAGEAHVVPLRTERLAAGAYVLRVRGERSTATRRFTVVARGE